MRFRSTIHVITILGALTTFNSATQAGQVTINIDGFANNNGMARIVLMESRNGYKGTVPVADVISVPIVKGQSVWKTNLPSGEYAIIAHHDNNANNDLDRPLFNLPLEPYGYSNGANKAAGLPAWEEVRFEVTAKQAVQNITVQMNPFAAFLLALKSGIPPLLLILAGLAAVRFFRTRTDNNSNSFQKG
jgi:uncharacterized protein (DUF2141 family)